MTQALTRVFTGMLMLATILLIWNQVATAGMQKLGDSVEIATSEVPLWQFQAGTISLRRCADCELLRLRIDDNTVFHVQGTSEDDNTDDLDAKREIFLQSAREPSGRQGMLSLFIEVNTDYVRSVRLSPRTGD